MASVVSINILIIPSRRTGVYINKYSLILIPPVIGGITNQPVELYVESQNIHCATYSISVIWYVPHVICPRS